MKKRFDPGNCYKLCNQDYSAVDNNRLYCKKGCDADGEEQPTIELCRSEKCTEVCIRRELGEDESKLGSWSKYFSRAPTDADSCIEACYKGCLWREPEE